MGADRQDHAAGRPSPGAGGQLALLLDSLRRRARPGGLPTALPEGIDRAVRQVDEDEDLLPRFQTAATRAGCAVHVAAGGEWCGTVGQILRDHGVRTVVVEAGNHVALAPERGAELSQALAAAGFRVSSRLDDDTLFAVDAGITGVVAAIAETGTIVCESGSGTARGTSLIPPVHVAIVERARLVADGYDYFDRLSQRGEVPANCNLITGPSKTADIEGILVTGVHGPGHVHIVVLAEYPGDPAGRNQSRDR